MSSRVILNTYLVIMNKIIRQSILKITECLGFHNDGSSNNTKSWFIVPPSYSEDVLNRFPSCSETLHYIYHSESWASINTHFVISVNVTYSTWIGDLIHEVVFLVFRWFTGFSWSGLKSRSLITPLKREVKHIYTWTEFMLQDCVIK